MSSRPRSSQEESKAPAPAARARCRLPGCCPGPVHRQARRRVHYAYDVQGRRIAKTVCAPTCRRTGYLYQDGRLVMKTDAAGRITTHYVYTDGQPIAKIEVERGSRTRHRLYALHTGHLGAPLAATDEQARLVWRAQLEPFGQARISATARPDGSPFALNLHLPGQYFDAETGWHLNLFRDYHHDAIKTRHKARQATVLCDRSSGVCCDLAGGFCPCTERETCRHLGNYAARELRPRKPELAPDAPGAAIAAYLRCRKSR